MSIGTSERFRVILVSLLVLCLLPTAMTAPWLKALHNSDVDSNPVHFFSAFSSSATSDIAIRTRNQLANFFDDLLKATLVSSQQPILFARTLPALFEDNDSAVHRIDSKMIHVRAPPISTAASNLDKFINSPV